jgi:hypothetical protein
VFAWSDDLGKVLLRYRSFADLRKSDLLCAALCSWRREKARRSPFKMAGIVQKCCPAVTQTGYVEKMRGCTTLNIILK